MTYDAGSTADGTNPASSAASGATTSTTGPSIAFTFVSAGGWHYSGTIGFPPATIDFAKDISSSPPGSAQLKTTIVESVPVTDANPIPTVVQQFDDTDAGRPGGPKLRFTAGYFGYHVSRSGDYSSLGSDVCDSPGAPDTLAGADFNCRLDPGPGFAADVADTPTYIIKSVSADEKLVDRLVGGIDKTPYVWATTVLSDGGECDIAIYANGTVKKPHWKPSCGTLTTHPS